MAEAVRVAVSRPGGGAAGLTLSVDLALDLVLDLQFRLVADGYLDLDSQGAG